MPGYSRHTWVASALILGCSLLACTASAFAPLPDGPVNAVAVVPGPPEQYFVGGGFDRIGNRDTGPLALLNADGTVDTSFQVTFSGVSPDVQTLRRQGNGLLLVSGNFTHVNGQKRPTFARLHPDGSLDLNFQPSLGSGTITCIEQPPMYVIIGISWSVQLLDVENGDLLATYDAGGPVETIDAWDPEGTRLYVGGQFPGGVRHLKRIGTVFEEDPNFNPDGEGFYQSLPGVTPRVYVADVVRGGTAILVGGRFDGYEEMRLGWAWPLVWPRTNMAMLHPRGCPRGYRHLGQPTRSLAIHEPGRFPGGACRQGIWRRPGNPPGFRMTPAARRRRPARPSCHSMPSRLR